MPLIYGNLFRTSQNIYLVCIFLKQRSIRHWLWLVCVLSIPVANHIIVVLSVIDVILIHDLLFEWKTLFWLNVVTIRRFVNEWLCFFVRFPMHIWVWVLIWVCYDYLMW